MSARLPALIGAGLALATLPAHALVSAQVSVDLAAVTLGAVAAVYVGFALADGRPRILATELPVAVMFIGAAIGALYVSPWIAVGAYVLHGLWDWAHHGPIETSMPRWYIPFCAVFDVIFAAGLAAIWFVRQ